MSFFLAALGITLILSLFGLVDARRIRRSHGTAGELNAMVSTRLLVWAIALNVAALVLIPGTSATEARVALVAASVIFGVVVVVLRRQTR